MSGQNTIYNYYKTQSRASLLCNDNKQIRKRPNLSIIRSSPKKFLETESPDVMVKEVKPEVVVISSDEENETIFRDSMGHSTPNCKAASSSNHYIKLTPPPASRTINCEELDSDELLRTPLKSGPSNDNSISESTVLYSPEMVQSASQPECRNSKKYSENCNTNSNENQASNLSQSTVILTPRTSQKSSQASTSSHSSSNKEKYFSPTKKRAFIKRTPLKRNLTREYGQSYSDTHLVEDEQYMDACKGMDIKSTFLITIINKCLKNDAILDLLDEKSQQLLAACLIIPKPGIRLVCRLYWYQQRWYRRQKLINTIGDKNNEIEDPQFQEILQWLIEKEIITSDNNTMSFDDYTAVLNVNEIKNVCKLLKLKMKSKQNAVDAIRKFSHQKPITTYFTVDTANNNSKRVNCIMSRAAGPCYKLSDLARDALDKLHLLMYLGMNYAVIREKKLELALIQDKVGQETYPVDKEMPLDDASIVFKSRDEFKRYFDAHILYEKYLCPELDTKSKCLYILKVYKLYKEVGEEYMMRYRSLPPWLRRFTPPYLYVKLLDSGIQELKKDASEEYYQLALDILTTLISQIAFRQHRKAEWYAEKALILHKLLHRYDEAAEVLLEGFASETSEELKDPLRTRASLLAKQKNIDLEPTLAEKLLECCKSQLLENSFPADHVQKHHLEDDNNRRGKKKFKVQTEDEVKYVDAEDYCVIHYTSDGRFTDGLHKEGRIVTTIFFLLFWDIIYVKLDGVNGIFLSYYQSYPLDMFTDSFYINRKALIDDKLKIIASMSTDCLIETMRLKWDQRPDNELSGLDKRLGWDAVARVTACLGGTRVAALCRRLALNYAHARSGFPDLTLWNINTGQVKFVEVKTDTDKPSLKQLQWMQYLREHGIDTGFCYLGVNTTRSRARAHDT